MRDLPQRYGQVIVLVDGDSEVHRFVASAVTVYKKTARKRSKYLTKAANERKKSGFVPKQSHVRDIKTMEEASRLLAAMGILKKDVPAMHDESYDSSVLKARNKGGHLYVSPQFLGWAKELMRKVRASITVGVIRSLGNTAQQKAYEHLLKDGKLKKDFAERAKKSNIDELAIEWVFERVVNYAFHARSAVEWRKYKAVQTDRTTGKEKKMGTREKLKGGTTTKKEESNE